MTSVNSRREKCIREKARNTNWEKSKKETIWNADRLEERKVFQGDK